MLKVGNALGDEESMQAVDGSSLVANEVEGKIREGTNGLPNQMGKGEDCPAKSAGGPVIALLRCGRGPNRGAPPSNASSLIKKTNCLLISNRRVAVELAALEEKVLASESEVKQGRNPRGSKLALGAFG